MKYIDNNPFFQRKDSQLNQTVKEETKVVQETAAQAYGFGSQNPKLNNSLSQESLEEQTESQESIIKFLSLEVDKFLKTQRLTNQSFRELEHKLQVEIYLREKKEAILNDRKEENNADTKSQLSVVQQKLP